MLQVDALERSLVAYAGLGLDSERDGCEQQSIGAAQAPAGGLDQWEVLG